MKQGQLSILLILAGALILFFSLIMYSPHRTQNTDSSIYVKDDAQVAGEILHDCLKQTLESVLMLVHFNGGAIAPFNQVFVTNETYFSIVMDGPSGRFNSVKEVNDELSGILKIIGPSCHGRLTPHVRGANLEIASLPSVTVFVEDRFVKLTYKSHLWISKGSVRVPISTVEVVVPTRLKEAMDTSQLILSNLKSGGGKLDFTELADTPFFVTVIPFDSHTVLFELMDELVLLGDAPSVFRFGVKLP